MEILQYVQEHPPVTVREVADHFAQTNIPMKASAEDEEKRQFMFDSLVVGTSLQESLLTQVRESALPEDQFQPYAHRLSVRRRGIQHR